LSRHGPGKFDDAGRLRRLLAAIDISRLAWPKDCLACGRRERGAVCAECETLLEPLTGAGCRFCGNPEAATAIESCAWCDRLAQRPDRIASGMALRQVGGKLFRQVKFHGYWRLSDHLCQVALPVFFERIDFTEYDAMVSSPETFGRKLKRSFDPAGEICRWFERASGVPRRRWLRSRRARARQSSLDFAERSKNARGAFVADPSVAGKNLILVDDILTTGATLTAATEAVREMGAGRVAWWTLFRTP
jgi:ComF family protein